MAANKKPSSCRKYRDKISVHNQHQNKTENEFSTIMAEMQELKRSAVKPEPHNVISSLQNNQGHFHGSLPNLDSVHMTYKDHLRDCTYSPGIQKQLVIPDTTSLLTPSLRRYSGGGIIRQRSVERRELHSSAPYSYSRSRSPSPNTNTAQVKAQPVILSHRERFDPLSTSSNAKC